MKTPLLAAALLVTAWVSAQDTPRHEIENGLVKSTYYHSNGAVAQTGYYKDGKVHGLWTSFDENGHKTAIAQYEDGRKTGKWLFWNGDKLSEVDYTEGRIAAVKTWKQDALAKR